MQFDHSTDTIDPDITEVLTIAGTGGVELPFGTTAQRPSSPQTGLVRFNTSTNTLEWANSAGWEQSTSAQLRVLTLTDASSELVGTSPPVYTLTGDYNIILVNTTVAINIELQSTPVNRKIDIKLIGTGSYTLVPPSGGGTLDGSTSSSTVNTRYTSVTVLTPGSSAWYFF